MLLQEAHNDIVNSFQFLFRASCIPLRLHPYQGLPRASYIPQRTSLEHLEFLSRSWLTPRGVQVNADEHRLLAKRFGVQGYPMMKYWTKGSTGDGEVFAGERTAERMVFAPTWSLVTFPSRKCFLARFLILSPRFKSHLVRYCYAWHGCPNPSFP